MVDGRPGHVRPAGDLVQRDPVEADLGEQLGGPRRPPSPWSRRPRRSGRPGCTAAGSLTAAAITHTVSLIKSQGRSPCAGQRWVVGLGSSPSSSVAARQPRRAAAPAPATTAQRRRTARCCATTSPSARGGQLRRPRHARAGVGDLLVFQDRILDRGRQVGVEGGICTITALLRRPLPGPLRRHGQPAGRPDRVPGPGHRRAREADGGGRRDRALPDRGRRADRPRARPDDAGTLTIELGGR